MRSLVAAVLALLVSLTASALDFPPSPRQLVAVNPVTNKVYLANESAGTVTVLDAAHNTTKTITVGSRPQFIVVNPITNRVYVNNGGAASLSIIDGSTDTNLTPTPLALGSQGPMAINTETNVVYEVRMSSVATDEVTFFDATSGQWYTIATESFQPTALTINPVTNTLYVAHYGTGDVRVISGAYNNNAHPTTFSIPAWSHPFAIAANSMTNKVYVITEDSRGPLGIIDGATNTATWPALAAGHGVGPKALAVDPVNNKVYALFGGEVIVLNADNTLTYIPVATGTGVASLGINYYTNKIYVANDSGSMSVIDGTTNTATSVTIPAGSSWVGINPVTNEAYLFDGTSATIVNGSPTDPSHGNPILTNITGLPGNTSGPGGSISVNASNMFSNPLPLKGLYYQFDSKEGAWSLAGTGTGPYSISLSGLSAGSHTLYAFAIEGHATVLDTGPQSMPLMGSMASYAFTVTAAPASSTTSLLSSANPSTVGQSVTFTAAVSGGSGPTPTGSVAFTDGGTAISGCAAVALASGSATCTTASLAQGSHSITATYSGSSGYTSSNASLTQTVQPPAPTLTLSVSPSSIDFGGESMGTASFAHTVTVTNTGTGTVTISNVAATAQFSQTSACSSLAPGASCTVTVTFNPAPQAGDIGSTAAVSGSLSVSSNASSGTQTVTLSGTAEKSLVTHYYEAALHRVPDAGGKAHWLQEELRMQSDGVSTNDAWLTMAMLFVSSAEYASVPRDNAAFISDMYRIFLGREPDSGGLNSWVGQLDAGLPREVAETSFMLSAESASFLQSIFGNPPVRAEVTLVMDFYRGALERLPDDGGFAYWVQQFRAAQCQGVDAINSEANIISNEFFNGPEYAALGRTNTQFVADLYDAFLRRGGDASGVNYWIGQLNSGARTRNEVRQQFANSPEFLGRVNNVLQQGCMK